MKSRPFFISMLNLSHKLECKASNNCFQCSNFLLQS
jgi:hypothetical protein